MPLSINDGAFLYYCLSAVRNDMIDLLKREGLWIRGQTEARAVPSPNRRRVRQADAVSLDRLVEGSEETLEYHEIVPDKSVSKVEDVLVQQERWEELIKYIVQAEEISQDSKQVLLRGYLLDWDDDKLVDHLGKTRENIHTIRSRDMKKLRESGDLLKKLKSYR